MYSLLVRRLTLFTLSHIFVSHFVSQEVYSACICCFSGSVARWNSFLPKNQCLRSYEVTGLVYYVLYRDSSSPTESNISIQVSSQWNSVYVYTGDLDAYTYPSPR